MKGFLVSEEVYISYQQEFRENLELFAKFFLELEKKQFMLLEDDLITKSIIDSIFDNLNSSMNSLICKKSLYLNLNFPNKHNSKEYFLQTKLILNQQNFIKNKTYLSLNPDFNLIYKNYSYLCKTSDLSNLLIYSFINY